MRRDTLALIISILALTYAVLSEMDDWGHAEWTPTHILHVESGKHS